MAPRQKTKDPLPGLFILAVLCVAIGVFVRYKAWQAGERLRTWTRVNARVATVEPFRAKAGRYGSTTRLATSVAYDTPTGPAVRRVVLNSRPSGPEVPVYFDPADPDRLPEAEAQLRAVSSPSNTAAAYGFGAAGVLLLGLSIYVIRRRYAGVRAHL